MNREADPQLPKWEDCDLFCIREYASAGGSACGWRGRTDESLTGEKSERLCPRCGQATLLKISLEGPERLRS